MGILQARILEWVAFPFSKGSSQSRSPALQADSLPSETPGKPPEANCQLIGKTLMLGKTEGKRRRGQQRMRWLDSITDLMDMNLSDSMDMNLSKL